MRSRNSILAREVVQQASTGRFRYWTAWPPTKCCWSFSKLYSSKMSSRGGTASSNHYYKCMSICPSERRLLSSNRVNTNRWHTQRCRSSRQSCADHDPIRRQTPRDRWRPETDQPVQNKRMSVSWLWKLYDTYQYHHIERTIPPVQMQD